MSKSKQKSRFATGLYTAFTPPFTVPAELAGKGYASDVNQPGVFILDLTDLVPESGLDYINFGNVSLANGQTTTCTGTHSLAYSQVLSHHFLMPRSLPIS